MSDEANQSAEGTGVDDTTEHQVDESTSTEQESNQSSMSPDMVRELLEQNKLLVSQVRELTNKVIAPKPETPAITQAQLQELYKTDPGAAIDYIVNQRVEQKVERLGTQLSKNQLRDKFDAKAEAEFPAIKTDPEFRNTIKQEIDELLASGDFTKESPRLVYTATQIAALKHQAKNKARSSATKGMSAEAPSSNPVNMPATSSAKNVEKWATMFGIKDKEWIKKQASNSNKPRGAR